MPIYEYRCSDGHRFEVFQAMADDPVTACEVCGKPVERVFHPIAVHFKGSGFYTTDYAKKGADKSGSGSSDEGASKSESSSDGKAESTSESKSESKPDSKSESKTKD